MSKFSQKFRRDGDVLHLLLSGVMDEDAQIPIPDLGGIKTFRVDFGGITGINSCGVRDWIVFLQKLPPSGFATVYAQCHPSIVEQLNMATSFVRKDTQIESFYAGYFCPECEHEKELLFTSEKLKTAGVPTMDCGKCASRMEFDGDEELYFRFLVGA